MNKFEKEFFKKYIPESQEILGVVHVHFMVIFDRIFLLLIFGFLLPSFLLYNSELFRSFAPFYIYELIFFLVFLKIIFDIFDWYNDAWVVTDS
jgi:hypothetical protein